MNKISFDKAVANFFNNLDPELTEALLNPTVIDSSKESLQRANGAMILPLMICDNPDTQLSNVPNQLNFLLPLAFKNPTDPYIINIKNDINMYRKTYEQYSKQVNQIIEKTKKSMKNLYPPLKKLRNDIKNYSKKFEESIKQLPIPLENKKESLNEIDYKKYPEDIQKEFLSDKSEIIKEINDFIKETHQFCETYEKMNKYTLEQTEEFVQQFTNLAVPANELATFMKNFFKVFEKSSASFNDLHNKEKVNKALQKIKEPINIFQKKAENTQNLLIPVEIIGKENKIENIKEIIKENHKIMENLKKKSDNISKKIKILRDKYGEKPVNIKSMNMINPEPVNITEYSKQLEQEKKEINKEAEKQVNKIKEDGKEIINQTRLDLLFIMDITNSMDLYLNQAKEEVLDMIKEIEKQCPGIEIYLGFIGYRDFIDLDFGDEYINLELTTNYEQIKQNIAKLTASGGGDTAEDLCGALELAENKKWIGKSRFAILVTDSPCHGKKYHNLKEEGDDNFPDGDKYGRIIEQKIAFLSKSNVSLFCLKISPTTDKMFGIFKDVYNNNKKKDSNNQFVVEKGDNLFKAVTENAVKTFQNRKNLEIKEN